MARRTPPSYDCSMAPPRRSAKSSCPAAALGRTTTWLVLAAALLQAARSQVPPPPHPGCTRSCGGRDHGKCTVDKNGDQKCACTDGWKGDDCDHPTGCDLNPCDHGECHANGAEHTCACTPGWTHSNCDHATGCDQPTPADCGHGKCHPVNQNDGVDTPKNTSGDTRICICDDGWKTSTKDNGRCTLATGCDNYPCGEEGKHGTCHSPPAGKPDKGGEHICTCNCGYTGDQRQQSCPGTRMVIGYCLLLRAHF